MQTSFTLAQLADPHVSESEKILRACVHCGFCTATCPTYVLDGNELDSPRGRIYLIKEMLENDRPATEEVTRHVDRCLSCLACMTTCPSGVHYMHLVDHARVHIESTYRRPLAERLLRAVLAMVMPFPQRFWLALPWRADRRNRWRRSPKRWAPRIAAMLRLSPWAATAPTARAANLSRCGRSRRRGPRALLAGCVNDILARKSTPRQSACSPGHGVEWFWRGA
jgi:glycolate oxidase iron-sulfur subunit